MQAHAPTDFELPQDHSEHRETAVGALMAYFYKCEELARYLKKKCFIKCKLIKNVFLKK